MNHTKNLILVFFIVSLILPASSFAMYNPHTGRFLQQDPLGIRDGICLVNFSRIGSPSLNRQFSARLQYSTTSMLFHKPPVDKWFVKSWGNATLSVKAFLRIATGHSTNVAGWRTFKFPLPGSPKGTKN
jgi:hypothetical protein